MFDVAFLLVYILLTTERMRRPKCIVVENAVELSSDGKRRSDEKIEQRSTIRSDLL